MKKYMILWLILILVSPGSYSAEYEWLAHATAVTDALTTKLGADKGATEGNTLWYSENPTDKEIAAALIYRIGLIRFVNWFEDKETAKDFNIGMSLSHLLTTKTNILITYEMQF